MYVGHLALAFGAKRVIPRAILGALIRWRGHSPRAALWLAGLVVSHWVLDVLSHAPDMPLWPGSSPKLGFGLWNSIPATLIVEGALWLAGIGLYLRARRAQSWMGWLALGSFVLFNTVMWTTSPWAPMPPTAVALARFSLFAWLLVPWAVWVDRSFLPK